MKEIASVIDRIVSTARARVDREITTASVLADRCDGNISGEIGNSIKAASPSLAPRQWGALRVCCGCREGKAIEDCAANCFLQERVE
jgi:hypothetical protein